MMPSSPLCSSLLGVKTLERPPEPAVTIALKPMPPARLRNAPARQGLMSDRQLDLTNGDFAGRQVRATKPACLERDHAERSVQSV